jgi:predicted metal-binding protein
MIKIGIIICGRYKGCGGGKCFRALRERVGAFKAYSKEEQVEIIGFSSCGDCPGGNVEYVPEEMKKNGAQVIHLATGMVVGYPPCPNISRFKEYIETAYQIPVVIGTHPIPDKYMKVHKNLTFWREGDMEQIAGELMKENRRIMEAYN